MKRFGLATQIFIALLLGIFVGALFHGNETVMAILVPIRMTIPGISGAELFDRS
ncbi:hypothetical protein [Peribacillus frigoritolerans]|uniref:hypothetical protein n=1 Tax=Peribacillus frigoritolerans TaxID=450367 RepID=UPI00382D93F6